MTDTVTVLKTPCSLCGGKVDTDKGFRLMGSREGLWASCGACLRKKRAKSKRRSSSTTRQVTKQ